MSVVPLPGPRPRVVVSHTDITTRKLAVDALRESEERFRVLFEHAAVGVAQVDRKTWRIVRANQQYADLLGRSREELIGLDVKGVTVPEDVPSDWDSRGCLETGGMGAFSMEKRYVRKDGSHVWVRLTVAPMGEVGTEPEFNIAVAIDITDQKLAELALRESEEKFRAVFEESPTIMGLTSREGGLIDVNRAFTEDCGFAREQIIGKPSVLLGLWVDPDQRWRYYDLLERQGYVTNFEAEVRRRDGVVLTALFSGRTIHIGGKPYGLVSMVDITDRKRTERALELLSTGTAHLSGELFFDTIARQLASVLDVQIAFVATLLGPDQSRARTLGLAIDGERGGPWEFALLDTPCGFALAGRDAVYLEDVRQRFPRFQQLTDERVMGYAGIPLLDTDGRPLGVLAVMSRAPLRDWEQTRAILRLFAVRTAAELARQQSEQQFHDLFEFSPDAILIVNDQGTITLANRQAVTMFGYPRDELVGLQVDRLVPDTHRGPHTEQRASFGAAGHARMMGTRPALAARRKDGTVFSAGIGLSPISSDTGVQVVTAVRDLTEQVRAEERREVLHAQLRQSQKMQAIGTLASGIAHDFNNILTIAQANLELARRDLDPKHGVAKDLDEIGVALSRAGDLVRRILTFSREQSSKRTVVSLRRSLQETARLLRSALPSAVALEIGLEDAPWVVANATQIHQVLMNLATNAWQALEGRPGSIVMSVDTVTIAPDEEHPPTELTPGRYARLTVRDTGKGMDSTTLERIFEPFFTTKTVGSGTGLGLAVVHGIIADHGGRVTVESRPGEGSTFRVYLPGTEETRDVASSRPPTPLPGHGLRVLCIDDEAQLALASQHLLTPLGYGVRTFTSPTDALVAFRSDPTAFDVIVSDFNMPQLSGLDLAVEVMRVRPELPVVLVSGYVSEENRRKAAAVGVRQIIQKPYTAAMLSAAIVRHVRGE
jgi:PAS domain S-box-containing protein